MISVVIPVYEAVDFIPIIIECIQRQTYEEYEIIFVDDGSTDGSLELCQKYAKTNSKIQVIEKTHSGVGRTRNKGIEAAKGEYIAFVDVDDRIEPDYLERLIQNMDENDLVISSFDRLFYKNGKLVNKVNADVINAELTNAADWEKHFEKLYVSTLIGIVYCKLYRRDIIIENQLRFSEDVYIGEDYIFNYQYIKYCKKIRCFAYRGYHYICGLNDSLTRKLDLQKIEFGKNLFCKSLDFAEELGIEQCAVSSISNIYLRNCFINLEYAYKIQPRMSGKQKREYIATILHDEYTEYAVKNAKATSKEFTIYKKILNSKNIGLVSIFTWCRWKYKKMVGRA